MFCRKENKPTRQTMSRKFNIVYYLMVTLFTVIIAYQIYRLAVLVFPTQIEAQLAVEE